MEKAVVSSTYNVEQVIYTHGAQANSACHPSRVRKWLSSTGNTRY